MTSNSEPTEVFATWTARFDVEVDRAGQRLIFKPLLSNTGRIQRRNLFERPDEGNQDYSHLIEALLSLEEGAPDSAWKTVAERLGPIIQHHPAHHAHADGEVTERMAQWLDARERLYQFWTMAERLAGTSRIPESRLTPEQKREEAVSRLWMDDEAMSRLAPDDLERLIEAHMPPKAVMPEAISPALKLVDDIGHRLNEVFQDNSVLNKVSRDKPGRPAHPRIVPLINPETFEVEIVVPQGLQALFLMSCILLHKSNRGFLRRCKRANCARTVFMSRRQDYCCQACQEADKTLRARMRKRAGVAGL